MEIKSKVLFDVFVSDPLSVNKFIYRSWLDGYSEKEAANMREDTRLVGAPRNLIIQETEDQYRNFTLLQKALEHPKTLSSHSMFQMDSSSRRLLIEGYYDFDEILMRELIGRKLTSGQRRDLDDASEKLKIRQSSCERQFDNLKRISRLVFSDLKTSALDIIMNEFSLPRELSRKYVWLLFLCFHRVDLSKKRIQFLSTFDLIRLSEIIMNHWGDPLRTYTMELDMKLKEDVRDLKTHLNSQKEISEYYMRLIKTRYQSVNSSPRILPSSSSSISSVGIIDSSSTPNLLSNNNSNINSSTSTSIHQPPMSGFVPPMFTQQQQGTSSNTNIQQQTPIFTSSSAIVVPPNTYPLSNEKIKALESKFRSILKGILAIGSNLSDSKEFRNLFEDIVEKVIDPLKRIDLTIAEADTFFIHLREVFNPEQLSLTLRHRDRVVHNWKSFLEGIRGVVLYIYSNV